MAQVVVGLAEAIAALRAELVAAIAAGENERMRFRLAPVELSLQVAVSKGADGRIGWSVLGVGGTNTAETTQTLKVVLEPAWLDEEGAPAPDFLIASQDTQAPGFGPRA